MTIYAKLDIIRKALVLADWRMEENWEHERIDEAMECLEEVVEHLIKEENKK